MLISHQTRKPRKMEVLRILTALSLFCTANAFFKSCSKNADLLSVTVDGTSPSGSSPYILKRGTNATLEIKFKSNIKSDSIKAVCHGIIGPLPVPFKLPDSNGCNGLSPGCPILPGKTYTYTTSIPVLKEYPAIKLIIRWEDQITDGTDVLCFNIPAQIE